MSPPRRIIVRAAIILFCLWHMTAIAAYTIPASAKGPISAFLKRTVVPAVRPYLLLTSQWQQWNLFSPDPLRMVVSYRLDVLREGKWEPVSLIAPETVQWWRRASELKMMMYLEPFRPHIVRMRQRYVSAYCGPLGLPPGTQVRMAFIYYRMPLDNRPLSWWQEWQPEKETSTTSPMTCPDPSAEEIAEIVAPPPL